MGQFRVIDTLTTLAFDFPTEHPRAIERAAYFKGELEQFLSQESRTGGRPDQVLGSYAGAMGMPQFMPSSWVKYAIDYKGDGQIDLTNPADAIGSVASYFKAYGWQTGMPATYAAQLAPDSPNRDTLLAPDILPSFTATSLLAKGVDLPEAARQHVGPLAWIELENGANAAPTSFVGTENFYVITRYNWSAYYAEAVIELGDAVEAALAKSPG